MPYVSITEEWIEANVAPRFGVSRGDDDYHAGIDVNRDGTINIEDVSWFSRRVGETVYVPDKDAKIAFRLYRGFWVSKDDVVSKLRSKWEEQKSKPATDQMRNWWASLGDINKDGVIDDADVQIMQDAYGSTPGDPNWNPLCDLNDDGVVDVKDSSILGRNYGRNLENERQHSIIDYPIEVSSGPWFCEEFTVTCYGSPVEIGFWTAVAIFLLILALVGGVIYLGVEVMKVREANQLLVRTNEEVIQDLEDLKQKHPEVTDEVNQIIDKIEEATEKARNITGNPNDWLKFFWKITEWMPVFLILMGAAIVAPVITRLIPTRR